MEPVGASLEGEWSCLSGIYTNEEADFMAQLLGSGFGVSSAFWSSNESGTIFNHDFSDFSYINYNEKLYSYSGGSSFCFSTSSDCDCEPVLVNNNNISISIHDVTNHTASYLVEGINDQYSRNMEIGNGNLEEYAQLPDHNFQPKIETEIPCSKPSAADKSNANPSEISKKRSKKESNDEKTKRNVRSKKSQKLASSSNSSEEWNAAGLNGPATSSCCSDDESNELNGGSGSSRLTTKSTPALNSNGKTRAGRGAATDPQSLYARKRRERINERLRILQNLVPNGTKVDISTMLEEAVHYVKFLQLQIKLLSSDDLWMYAPIAYKGMDIGLDRKLPAPL